MKNFFIKAFVILLMVAFSFGVIVATVHFNKAIYCG